MTITASSGTTLTGGDERRSGVCSSVFSNHETPSYPLITSPTQAPLTDGILAGFKSTFVPGTGPFACDQLITVVAQGVFEFDVGTALGSVAPGRVAIAQLLATKSIPREPVWVLDNEHWGARLGEGVISERFGSDAGPPGLGEGRLSGTTPRDYCFFRIVTARAGETVGTWGAPLVAASALDAPGPSIRLPHGRGGDTVAREVESALASGQPARFIVQPFDPAVGAKASNTCVGMFTFQLLLATTP